MGQENRVCLIMAEIALSREIIRLNTKALNQKYLLKGK